MIRPSASLITILVLTACNTAPSTALVKIVPVAEGRIEDTVRSSDDLVVEFLAAARDLDNDPLDYAYTWEIDGVESAEFTTDTVPASATTKGQVWRVTVIPSDGKRKGDAATAEITIGNDRPVAEATTPFAEVISTDALTMTGTGVDPDGDEVQMLYYWTNDGEGQPFDGPDVPAAFTYPGETWIGHAVAFDGEEKSEPATIEIKILNGLPVINGITFTEEAIYTDTELVAVVDAEDPDDQPVELTYTWTVDGTTVQQGVDRSVLDPSLYRKDQVVELTVVPNDSVDDGIPVTTSVTILNTPPTQPVVEIFPSEPIPGVDEMQCRVVTPSVDVDGDPIDYRIGWQVNGAEFSAATTTDVTNDTVGRALFFDDEEWRCEMTPFDDDEDGLPVAIEVIPETWAGPRVFTTCDNDGSKGPKQIDCDGSDGYLNTTLEDEVTIADGIQEWTVPVTGTYRITARGAQGKSIDRFTVRGGYGAVLRGDFELERGEVLQIAVGQVGRDDGGSAGGGGASWVMRSDDSPLLIAGGGGASNNYGGSRVRRNGCDALTGLYASQGGGTSFSSVSSTACLAKTTDLRRGGRSVGSNSGNGGGGLDSDGGNDASTWTGGTGGKSWANGVAGGSGAAQGGFGAGGSGNGSWGSGGGGGYSGGDSGTTISGGGGSFNGGANPSNSVNNTDAGEVNIDLLELATEP